MEGSLLEGEHGESFGMVASPLGKHDQLIKKKKSVIGSISAQDQNQDPI
jgi:hypothetical protein